MSDRFGNWGFHFSRLHFYIWTSATGRSAYMRSDVSLMIVVITICKLLAVLLCSIVCERQEFFSDFRPMFVAERTESLL